MIDGAVLGSDERGAELLAGLRALRPFMDTFARVPAKSLVRLHMDPEGGAPFASDSAMLASFPDAAVDAFIAEAGPDAQTSLLMAELRQLGGALGRSHEGGGVLSRLDGEFVSLRRRHGGHPGDGRAGARRRGPVHRGARAVRQRSRVPQLRREPRRHPGGVRRGRVDPADRHPQRRRPARRLRRQPPGAAALRERPARPAEPSRRQFALESAPVCSTVCKLAPTRHFSVRGPRVQSVPGGPDSSQDWKPISEAGDMASSIGPVGVEHDEHHVLGVERHLLGALGGTAADEGDLGALQHPLGSGPQREVAEPLQRLAGVAAEAEKPTAPGMFLPDAVAELEGPAVTGEQATTDDQAERRRTGRGRAAHQRRQEATATPASTPSVRSVTVGCSP